MPKVKARPSSYSESFIDIDREITFVEVKVPDKKPFVFLIKSSIHLFLISAFETIFFFTYVAGKEDDGIKTTINSYYIPIKNSCPSWSNITKTIVNDIIVGDIQKITSDGINSYNDRVKINTHLLYYSLAASGVFLVILGVTILIYKNVKINWLKTVGENVMMVLILGLYEYVFFMTIIYKYNSISTNELNSYIANGIYDCVKN